MCATWWSISAAYATLLKGHSHDAFHGYDGRNSLIGDYNVSIWNLNSPWLPLMNALMIFVPYPSIYYSTIKGNGSGMSNLPRYYDGPSEHMVFIMAIINALPIILSGIWSIRLMGLLGLCIGTQPSSTSGSNVIPNLRAAER